MSNRIFTTVKQGAGVTVWVILLLSACGGSNRSAGQSTIIAQTSTPSSVARPNVDKKDVCFRGMFSTTSEARVLAGGMLYLHFEFDADSSSIVVNETAINRSDLNHPVSQISQVWRVQENRFVVDKTEGTVTGVFTSGEPWQWTAWKTHSRSVARVHDSTTRWGKEGLYTTGHALGEGVPRIDNVADTKEVPCTILATELVHQLRSSTDPDIKIPADEFFEEHAATNFELGMAALELGDTILATQYFVYIQKTYPYAALGVLSQLREADAALVRGNYEVAVNLYSEFLHFNVYHEMVKNGYVSLMLSEAGGRVFDTRSEPDAKTRTAFWQKLEVFYTDFLVRYPHSPDLELAKKRLDEAKAKAHSL